MVLERWLYSFGCINGDAKIKCFPTKIAVTTESDIFIFDLGNFILLKTFSLQEKNGFCPMFVDMLSNNNILVGCSSWNETVPVVLDFETGTIIQSYVGHNKYLSCIKLLSIDTFSSGDLAGVIKIWDISTGMCLKMFQHEEYAMDLELSGELISCSYDGTIKIWDLINCTCIKTLDDNSRDYLESIKLYKNSKIISATNSQIKIRDLNSGFCFKIISLSEISASVDNRCLSLCSSF